MRDRVLPQRRPELSAPRPHDDAAFSAVWSAQTRPGLHFDANEGFCPWLPQFSELRPKMGGTAASIDAAAHLTRPVHAAVEYEGFLDVPGTGECTFTLEGSGKAHLRIHDIRAVERRTGQSSASG